MSAFEAFEDRKITGRKNVRGPSCPHFQSKLSVTYSARVKWWSD